MLGPGFVALVLALALVGCATGPAAPEAPAQPMPNPAELAPHEWDHGPPWSPYDTPWVLAPDTLAPWPGMVGVGVGVGGGVVVGRGWWWRGQPNRAGRVGWASAPRGWRYLGRR